MNCPFCGKDTKVVDKRETADGTATRRRRQCLRCKKRFTTYERVETAEIMVVKKDGRREAFDRGKLKTGILKACEKRPVPMETIEQVVEEIEREMKAMHAAEITTSAIGNLVMKKLRKVDKVAYIRFASVYRDFTDLETFHHELKRLIRGKR